MNYTLFNKHYIEINFMDRIKLIEEEPQKLFSGGVILKLGTYSISPEGIFYGIHIPTDTRKTAELIMKQILDDRKFIENFKRALPYLKETLTEQEFGTMQVLMDEESRKILAYLASDN